MKAHKKGTMDIVDRLKLWMRETPSEQRTALSIQLHRQANYGDGPDAQLTGMLAVWGLAMLELLREREESLTSSGSPTINQIPAVEAKGP